MNYVLNRALLYRDRRDIDDSWGHGKPEDLSEWPVRDQLKGALYTASLALSSN